MLTFVDLPKGIRFLRVETGDEGPRRTILGRVSKPSLTVEPALSEQLEGDELEEIEKIIACYVQAEVMRRRVAVLNIPVILRETMEYFETEASDEERRLIFGAIMETLRRVRKYERDVAKSKIAA
jgi:hypothetical protein